MKERRIRAFLQEHESTSLDFKRDQYSLTTDEEKGELMKDLLAFANTPSKTDAHIIIGITEEPTPPHTITGITEERLDHHLQELVNKKLNRPITFSYETHQLDGRTIGIITIARKQHPPHHLKKDFGRLRKDTVYLRRGSSTATATPDEITNLTRPPRKLPSAKEHGAALQALAITAMYREDEIITVRGGRGIPGLAYDPPRQRRFSLGHYIRLDAKLLITPPKPVVIIRRLSTATITTADDSTIPLDTITIENGAETIDVPTARVLHITGQARVDRDLLEASRADRITIIINLSGPRDEEYRLQQPLRWDARTKTFPHQHERSSAH